MIIDGKKFAQKLKKKIKKEIQSIKKKTRLAPGLTVILLGHHAPSEIYVRNKQISAKEVGINSKVLRFKSSISESKLISVIRKLNKDKKVHGILVQLPLPNHINGHKIIEEIDPRKDVDGFHPMNVGNLSSGKEKANLVKGDWVKKGAIVIDVGINRIKKKKGYKIVGDVEFKDVVKKVKAITPVPGGVGPVTIACLLNNTLKAFKNIN
ncbi:MAG: hypothetical protein EBV18_01260 [Proteobacteria bacterium]|nr:hypothetical protein [Candidatus Fonsibacter lacus]